MNANEAAEAENPLERKVTYTFPASEINLLVDAQLTKIARTAKVNGFRPGRAPLNVMRQRWGKQCLTEILAEKAGEKFVEEVKTMKERPVSTPHMLPPGPISAENYKVELIFEVLPEVPPPAMEKQTVRRASIEIGDKEIDEMTERFRRQRGRLHEVSRPAGKEDVVTVDFRAWRGDKIAEKREGARWNLNSDAIDPEVAEALAGASAGDSRETVVKRPAEKPNESEESEEQEIRIEMDVKAVNEIRLPDLNDEFFALFGINEGGLEAFRKFLGGQIRKEADARLRTRMHNESMRALSEATPHFPLPQKMVHEETASILDEVRKAAREQGIPESAAHVGPEMVVSAMHRVRMALIIAAWRQRERAEAEESEVERQLDEIAGSGENAEETKARIRQDERTMNYLRLDIIERKAAEWTLNRARIEDVPVTLAELLSGS